jgi:hypothetical protein
MAHFAQIDENNIVQHVLVVDNSQEHRGQEFLADDLGLGGRWIQTSYNGNFRKQYAGIGFYYDETKDIFVSIQPFQSWTLDENNDWKAPIEHPLDGKLYLWNEENKIWEEILITE